MGQQTRRDFLRAGLAGTLLAGSAGAQTGRSPRRSATDFVPLGRSGIQVTRLACGTGTFNGSVQRALGQEEFTRMIRHAYDRGIRFFETAEAYQTPAMLGQALKGLPRDSYRLMTKFMFSGAREGAALADRIDRARRLMGVEYFDIALMHFQTSPNWRTETRPMQDGLDEAKVKKIALAHGASFHGLPSLSGAPGYTWLDVALLRINHAGVRMDTENPMRDSAQPREVATTGEIATKIHAQGTGVLGMKLVGEGQFTSGQDRQKALDHVFRLGAVDAVTIGFKSAAEVDEAIERMDRALNS